MDLDAGPALEVAHVPIAQVTKAGRLALGAYALVEGQRFRNGVVVARGMRADLLELANVLVLARGGGH